MNTKDFITQIQERMVVFNQDIIELDKMLSGYLKKKYTETSILAKFRKLNRKYSLNPIILVRLLTFLQLANDEKFISTYSLNDIGETYKKLASVYKDDAEIILEYFHFINNIEDKEKKAKNVLIKSRNRIFKKLTTQGKSAGEGKNGH